MSVTYPVLPGREPFHVGEGRIAVALCHGFTGSPHSMRPWAEALADAGFHVDVPLLPGHGTHWKDLSGTQWTQWVRELESSVDRLMQEHDKVFIGGLSMGGALALRVAELRPKVAGLMLVNPALASFDRRIPYAKWLRWAKPTLPGIANDIARRKDPGDKPDELAYDTVPLRSVASMYELWQETRAALLAVDQPLLLFRSQTDHVVDDATLPLLLNHVTSKDIALTMLPESYHVATLDYDASLIHATSIAWLRAHV